MSWSFLRKRGRQLGLLVCGFLFLTVSKRITGEFASAGDFGYKASLFCFSQVKEITSNFVEIMRQRRAHHCKTQSIADRELDHSSNILQECDFLLCHRAREIRAQMVRP